MKFSPMKIEGAYLIGINLLKDERGAFGRSFCHDAFLNQGLNTKISQCNISCNNKKGTLRGMHYQRAPQEEAKLIRCIRGHLFDAFIDLRPQSPTYLKWDAIELREDSFNQLYLPEGVAHGFLTLSDNTQVLYQMSKNYAPDYATGILWNDPLFSIDWPFQPIIISEKDTSYPHFKPCKSESLLQEHLDL